MAEMVVTKWSPDHCQCVVNYSWERGSSEDTRIHTFHSADKICDNHKHIGFNDKVYEAVLEENQRKNILLQHAIDSNPTKLADIVNHNDKTNRRFKFTAKPGIMVGINGVEENIDRSKTSFILREDVEYTYFFEGTAPNRVLNVSFSVPLTDEEKKVIEARFPEKVKVV